MKKYLLILFILVLALTGCGKKENSLVCSLKVETIDVFMHADFKDDNLDYLGLEYQMDLNEYSDSKIELIENEDMCETVKTSMDDSGLGEAITNCKQVINENKILEITADFDLDKMIDAEISRKTSVDEIIEELSEQGYTCEIK